MPAVIDSPRQLHEIEKEIALELTRANTEAIIGENRFVAGLQSLLRAGIVDVISALPREIAEKQIPTWANSLAAKQAETIALVQVDTEIYLESVARSTTDTITQILANHLPLEVTEAVVGPGGIYKVDKAAIDAHISRAWTKDGKTWQTRANEISAGGASKFEKILQEGLHGGKGYYEIAHNIKREMAGNAYKIERLVRTEGQRIQNEIALESYKANSSYISGIEYTSTLDVRTCVVCGSYDRNEYFFDGEKQNLPDAASAPLIPQHPLCRCFYVPITKFWEKYFGGDWQAQRASQFGSVTGNYEYFLRRIAAKDKDWIKAHLGKFYEEWQKGRSITTLKFTPAVSVGSYLSTLPLVPQPKRVSVQGKAKKPAKEPIGLKQPPVPTSKSEPVKPIEPAPVPAPVPAPRQTIPIPQKLSKVLKDLSRAKADEKIGFWGSRDLEKALQEHPLYKSNKPWVSRDLSKKDLAEYFQNLLTNLEERDLKFLAVNIPCNYHSSKSWEKAFSSESVGALGMFFMGDNAKQINDKKNWQIAYNVEMAIKNKHKGQLTRNGYWEDRYVQYFHTHETSHFWQFHILKNIEDYELRRWFWEVTADYWGEWGSGGLGKKMMQKHLNPPTDEMMRARLVEGYLMSVVFETAVKKQATTGYRDVMKIGEVSPYAGVNSIETFAEIMARMMMGYESSNLTPRSKELMEKILQRLNLPLPDWPKKYPTIIPNVYNPRPIANYTEEYDAAYASGGNETAKAILERLGIPVGELGIAYSIQRKGSFTQPNRGAGFYEVRGYDFVDTRDGKEVWQLRINVKNIYGYDIDRIILSEGGKLVAYHDNFIIPEKEQSQGFGRKFLSNSIELYEKIGIQEIRLHAGNEDKAKVGGYVWAKAGFDCTPEQLAGFKQDIAKFLPGQLVSSVHKINDLAELTVTKSEYAEIYQKAKFENSRKEPLSVAKLDKEHLTKDGRVKIGKIFLLGKEWDGTLKLGTDAWEKYKQYVKGNRE